MPYACEKERNKERNADDCSSLAWTLFKCKIEFWPIHVVRLKRQR